MKHRAVIVGAGRIGAGWNWTDLPYTHAGAYKALADRVQLVAFVDPIRERVHDAMLKWGHMEGGMSAYCTTDINQSLAGAIKLYKPDIISICTQPERRAEEVVQCLHDDLKGFWIEKPIGFDCEPPGYDKLPPIQVNYMRRADRKHQWIAENRQGGNLTVFGKDDIHTKCHFEDLAKWWQAKLIYDWHGGEMFFDNGGVDGGTCFKAMLENLLDHIDKGEKLWSPPI